MTEDTLYLVYIYLIGIPVSFALTMAIHLSSTTRVRAKNVFALAFGSFAWPFLFLLGTLRD